MPEENKKQQNIWEKLLKMPAFYGFVAVSVVLLLALLVLLAVSGTKKTDSPSASLKISRSAGEADDGSLLYGNVEAYRSQKKYEKGILPTELPEATGSPVAPKTPEITATSAPETPCPTGGQASNGVTVVNDGRDYYVFDVTIEGLVPRKLEIGERFSSGIGVDDVDSSLFVSGFGVGLKTGNIFIENNYGAEVIDLRKLFASPLTITKSDKLEWARVILFHTFSNQYYCVEETDNVIKKQPDLAVYAPDYPITPAPSQSPHPIAQNNVKDIGLIVEKAAENMQVGVAENSNKCDANPEKAYEKSNELATFIANQCTTCELSIDLQREVFERPEGQRYKTVVEANGKSYAQVKVVVSEGQALEDNLKFAMLLLSRLEAKVPGISMGISLRPETYYNTTATKYGLLVDIGYEGNLVAEAENTAELLGETIAEIYLGE